MGMSNLSVKARLTRNAELAGAGDVVRGPVGPECLEASQRAEWTEMYGNSFQSAVVVNKMAALRRDNVRALDVALMTGDAELLARI